MKMSQSQYEAQYIANLRQILNRGTEDLNARTGQVTRRLPSTTIIVDLEEEFPILLSKTVQWKSCLKEIFWIYQKCSNNVKDLGSKIWDAWADGNGSIGKTYGYQVGQPTFAKDRTYDTQVHYVLDTLERDPSSRQAVIDMWDPTNLDEMALPPCVYSTIWNVIDGRLNCTLVQRSADYPVGVPFDTLGHVMLTHMFARHLGIKPGLLTHVMADSHIYAPQILGVTQQIARFDGDLANRLAPRLVFRDGAPTGFWDLTVDDIQIEDYEPLGPIKFDVAI